MLFLFPAFAFDFEVGVGVVEDFSESAMVDAVRGDVRAISGPWSVDAGGFVGLAPSRAQAWEDIVVSISAENGAADIALPTAGDVWGVHLGGGWGHVVRDRNRFGGGPTVGVGLDLRNVRVGEVRTNEQGPYTTDGETLLDAGPYLALGIGLVYGPHVGLGLTLTDHVRIQRNLVTPTWGQSFDLALALRYRF